MRFLILLAAILFPLTVTADVIDTSNAKKSVMIADREMSCFGANIVIDTTIPSEGAGTFSSDDPSEGTLILNPRMLNKLPPQVRWFVFSHECGHLHGIESEMGADKWAVERAIKDRWLTKEGTKQVCESFEDAPETDSHPSGARRCKQIDTLFAKLYVEEPERPKANVVTEAPPATPEPKVVEAQPWWKNWW